MLSKTNGRELAVVIAVVIAVVSLIGILGNAQTAGATEGTQYCGIIESTTGDKVATGFFYTDEGGRQYCSQIHDPASYVCMTDDGQLPTRTETTTQTILRRSEIVYTFRNVVWRAVPHYSSFKPDGPRIAIYGGSFGNVIVGYRGSNRTPEQQATWDAQFNPELVQIFEPGVTVTALPADNNERHLRDTPVIVPGPYAEVEVDVEVRYTNLVHNGNGICAPAGELPRYDSLPNSPSSPLIDTPPADSVIDTPPADSVVDYTPPADSGTDTHCPGCLGDASFERNERTGAISTHSADGTNVAHTRFVHNCVSSGMVMTSRWSCRPPSPEPELTSEEPELTCTQVSTTTTNGVTSTSYYCE